MSTTRTTTIPSLPVPLSASVSIPVPASLPVPVSVAVPVPLPLPLSAPSVPVARVLSVAGSAFRPISPARVTDHQQLYHPSFTGFISPLAVNRAAPPALSTSSSSLSFAGGSRSPVRRHFSPAARRHSRTIPIPTLTNIITTGVLPSTQQQTNTQRQDGVNAEPNAHATAAAADSSTSSTTGSSDSGLSSAAASFIAENEAKRQELLSNFQRSLLPLLQFRQHYRENMTNHVAEITRIEKEMSDLQLKRRIGELHNMFLPSREELLDDRAAYRQDIAEIINTRIEADQVMMNTAYPKCEQLKEMEKWLEQVECKQAEDEEEAKQTDWEAELITWYQPIDNQQFMLRANRESAEAETPGETQTQGSSSTPMSQISENLASSSETEHSQITATPSTPTDTPVQTAQTRGRQKVGRKKKTAK